MPAPILANHAKEKRFGDLSELDFCQAVCSCGVGVLQRSDDIPLVPDRQP